MVDLLRKLATPGLTIIILTAVAAMPQSAWSQGEGLPDEGETPLATAEKENQLMRLIEALRTDASFKVRLQAAVLLGRADDSRAVEPLISTLSSDEHYTVRAASATALANLNEPRAISHIIKRIATDTDPFVREEATHALGKYDPEDALPYVVATYGSDDPAVRKEAVAYLLAEASTGGAEPVLVKALGDLPEIFFAVEKAALEMPSDESTRFLTVALDHRDPGVRQGAVRVLHKIGDANAAKLILTVYERDIEADGVRTATRRALRDLRSHLPMTQIVADAQSNPQKHARARALMLLGAIGGADAEKVLLTALRDQDVYLRGTAVMAMAKLGDSDVVPSLEKLEADPANQRILHLVRHAIKQLRKDSGTRTN
ncbi:MAG: HEAT repeat domain-containing protein [Myxococcota bacterium]